MKKFKLCYLLTVSVIFLQSCTDESSTHILTSSQFNETKKPDTAYNIYQYNNTKGYLEGGQIITEFDCPDSKFFPPINLKLWDKTPAVNGRLPTYEETRNGTAIHHYGEKKNSNVKPYGMTLPKLAWHRNSLTKLDEIVVVIQIAQTDEDTIVGYRYLAGGCGGSLFRDYRFLTEEEVREAVGK